MPDQLILCNTCPRRHKNSVCLAPVSAANDFKKDLLKQRVLVFSNRAMMVRLAEV